MTIGWHATAPCTKVFLWNRTRHVDTRMQHEGRNADGFLLKNHKQITEAKYWTIATSYNMI